MKTYQYLMGLIPVIGRDVILENLRIVRGAYSKAHTSMADLDDVVKKIKIQDTFLAGFDKTYMSAMSEKLNAKNMISHYIAALPNVIANISLLEELVQGNLEESVATKSTTYKNASLLQLTEAADFALNYGITLANLFMLRETNALHAKMDGDEAELEADAPDPVVEKIKTYQEPFIRVMAILSQPVNDIRKSLESIPEVLVTETNFRDLSRVMGSAKLDPLSLETVTQFNGNPFLAWGRRRVERQNANYRLAQELLQCLKLRKLNMERALQGKKDASIENKIRTLQSRIDELTRQLEEMERD